VKLLNFHVNPCSFWPQTMHCYSKNRLCAETITALLHIYMILERIAGAV